MTPKPTTTPAPQNPDLSGKLSGFWAEDEWEFRYCPIDDGCSDYQGKIVYFVCTSPTLRVEMKYACWQKLVRQEWKTKTLWAKARDIKLMGQWLNHALPKLVTLTERDLNFLVTSFRTYLVNTGQWKAYVQAKLDGTQQERHYEWSSEINTLRQLYKIIADHYDDRDEYDKLVWDVRKLGFTGNPAKSSYTINFSEITQPWLLDAARYYIKYSLVQFSVGECQGRVSMVRSFSKFLQVSYPTLQPQEMERSVILGYMAHLVEAQLKEVTRLGQLVRLRGFLELCAREGWADVPDKRLIYSDELPRLPKSQPRYIPDDVLAQLNANLDGLSEPIQRMVLILQEVGMRISELCRMPFDCLLQDAQGDFFLRYYQYKMKKEHSVPISREVAAVIQEQQAVVKQQYGQHRFLFPSPNLGHKGEPYKHQNFSRPLNHLAVERNIVDSAGKVWRFQAHGFRHTVGTRMANLGVPQHIIQKYLGHESPQMTSRYIHIHDQTMKAEFAKFKSQLVDVQGQTVALETIAVEMAEGLDPDSLDEQWLKRNVLAQALPNGICGLPVVQKRCPYGANRCLTGSDGRGCPHFKTDSRYLEQHQEHLERTNKIVAWAQENPDSRRAQEILSENLPVQQNLQRIIAGITGGEASGT